MRVVTEFVDLVPLCPHCESPLDEVGARVVCTKGRSSPEFRFGKRYVYACPACRKALVVLPPQGVLGRLTRGGSRSGNRASA